MRPVRIVLALAAIVALAPHAAAAGPPRTDFAVKDMRRYTRIKIAVPGPSLRALDAMVFAPRAGG